MLSRNLRRLCDSTTETSEPYSEILGWPKSSFGFSHNFPEDGTENPNEILGQANI